MRKKILVTGAGGQLGLELQNMAHAFPDFKLVLKNRSQLDVTRPGSIAGLFRKHSFFACINCAAYTAVDKAESEPEVAFAINRDGAGYLAETCRQEGTYLLHLSTDYVYHSPQNTPFSEGDPVSPRGVYACSKLAGEQRVLAAGGMVLRTSWLYAWQGNNFLHTMLGLGADHRRVRVVCDQVGTPTWARDLAAHLLWILQLVAAKEVSAANLQGVFNYSNEGVASWYDFAVAIFEITDLKVQVIPIETAEYPTAAERPPYSLMNKARIRQTFGLQLPHWRESLVRCLRN